MTDREIDGKKTINSGFVSVISNILSVVISLITIIILTNMMSTEDMGIASSFITTQTIISYILFISIYSSINRALLEKKINNDEYLSTIVIFSIIMSVIGLVFYFLFKNKINSFFEFTSFMSIFLIVSSFLDNIFLYSYTKWNYDNEYKKIFMYNIISSPISQIISLLMVYILEEKYIGRIIGLKVLPCIIGLILMFNLLYKGKFKFNIKYLKYGILISFPTMWHLLSQIVLGNSDLLMIKKITDASNAGIYSIAYTISNVLITTIVSILKPWSPWVYRRLENNEEKSIYDASKLIIMLSVILCLGLVAISKEAIILLLNKSYNETIYLIPPLCLGMYFQILYLLFYDVEYYNKKNKQIAIYSIIAAIINIILNYIFIKKYGYIAAAYTTLISYFILCIMHYIGSIKCDKRIIFDSKYIFIASLITVICDVLMLVFIDYLLIKIIILLFSILILVIMNYKTLGKYINVLLSNNKYKKIIINIYNEIMYIIIRIINLFIITKNKKEFEKKQIVLLADFGLGDAINFLCIADKYRVIYPKDKYEITLIATNVSMNIIKKYTNFDYYIELSNKNMFKKFNFKNMISFIKIIKEKKYNTLIDLNWPFTRIDNNIFISMCIDSKEKIILINKATLKIKYKLFKKVYNNIIEIDDEKMSNLELYNSLVCKLDHEIDNNIKFKKLSNNQKINEKLISNKYCVIFPSSSSIAKNWDVDKYVELIKKMSTIIDYKFVFLGTKNDSKIVNEIASKLDKNKIVNLLGSTSFQEYINIISNSKFVVTNDTSAYHIAITENIPVAIITGVYTYDTFVRYDIKGCNEIKTYPIISKSRKCLNCHYDCIYKDYKQFPCLSDITVDYAYNEIYKMLKKEKLIEKDIEKNERKNK